MMRLSLAFAAALLGAAVCARAAEPASAAPSGAPAAQQTYLEGVLAYQKGDYAKARKLWTSCAASDSDCRMGLEKLDEMFPRSKPAPSKAEKAARQKYLEGLVYYQKGDYENAHKRWLACPKDRECRAGLEKLHKLWGFSTAPDGKK